MLALFLQLTFLQMHIDRPSAYLPGRANASKRAAIRMQSNALGCLTHLKYIREKWPKMRFENLAHVGLIPEGKCFEVYYWRLFDLLHLDYCIFYTMLPIHADNPTVSVAPHAASVDDILFPKQGEYMPPTQPASSLLGRAERPKQEVIDWYTEVIATVLVALKRATQLRDTILSQSFYPTSGDNGVVPTNPDDVVLQANFRKRLTLNHSYMAFVIKYVRQAEHVFKLLYRALRVKLALMNPGCEGNAVLTARARKRILQQVTTLPLNDPEFCLCIGLVPEGQPLLDADFECLQQMYTLYPLSGGPEAELLHRAAVLKTVPAGFLHSKISVNENEVRRTNVGIPGEVYRCDFAFSAWQLNTFAQYPPALMTSLRDLLTGLHTVSDMLRDEVSREVTGLRQQAQSESDLLLPGLNASLALTPEQKQRDALLVKRETNDQVERALNTRQVEQAYEGVLRHFTSDSRAIYDQLHYSPSQACKGFIHGVLEATKQNLRAPSRAGGVK
jgi:hypothetical protein